MSGERIERARKRERLRVIDIESEIEIERREERGLKRERRGEERERRDWSVQWILCPPHSYTKKQ